MGKRGPKPRQLISEKWSSNLAYAVGLLASDGCLSLPVHGYLIDLTSLDRDQLENYISCLGVPYKITKKYGSNGKEYLRVQFKNVRFYEFLLSIGLTPAKSKTIGAIKVPDKYFLDFLRGSFDGDGSSYDYYDPRWKSSFMFYLTFCSASEPHIFWMREIIEKLVGVHGHISKSRGSSMYSLRYAKREGVILAQKMYKGGGVCLARKRLKIVESLRILGRRL